MEEENCQRGKSNPGGPLFGKKNKKSQTGVLGGGVTPPVPFGRKWKLDKNIMKFTFFRFIPVGGWGSSALRRGRPPLEEEKWSGQRGLGVQR